MLGAILGDIIGSPYEFDHNNIKTTNFPLFSPKSAFTDDTVMTLAIAEGLLNGYGDEQKAEDEIILSMQKYGRMYPNAGYGISFQKWLQSAKPDPYDSYGNGSAMRVSSVAWIFDSLDQVLNYALITARVTHNHPEGIKGAKATAATIFLARAGKNKQEIKSYIEQEFSYDLSRTLDEIRPFYHHVESCQETVPEAITAFLESDSFEDAIRKAVSLGGDSDTLTAITGSIAEAYYGIPEALKQKALSMLDEPLLAVLKRYHRFMLKKRNDTQKYQEALKFATEKHRGQKRIGGDDYIRHPIAVAEKLRDKFYSVDYQITGLFHDLLEDTDATYDELLALGGKNVANAVVLLTKQDGYEMDDYITKIKASPIALAVKVCDRIHNLECAVVANARFKKKYILESIHYYIELDKSTKYAGQIRSAVIRLSDTLKHPLYEPLLHYIPYFEQKPKYQWQGEKQPDRTLTFPHPMYDKTISQFIDDCCLYGLMDRHYGETLSKYGVELSHENFQKAIPNANEALICAMITCYIRQERFCDGVLASAVEKGIMADLLKKIRNLEL